MGDELNFRSIDFLTHVMATRKTHTGLNIVFKQSHFSQSIHTDDVTVTKESDAVVMDAETFSICALCLTSSSSSSFPVH
jgi:hypothetical protein